MSKKKESPNSNLSYLLNNFTPKTYNQEILIELVESKSIIFATGSPGTGKTLVSFFCALKCVYDKNDPIQDIVYIRSEAKNHNYKNKGALPGDDSEKKSKLRQPMLTNLQKLVEAGEYAYRAPKIPCMYAEEELRGMDFERTFCILDEAQNTDKNVMLTMLTRMNVNSKLVVLGDSMQRDTDLFADGLNDAIERLKWIPEIGFVEFTPNDIVRNPLIKKIIQAYY
jgi:phosphate starvation-inducible PhoH-like protein